MASSTFNIPRRSVRPDDGRLKTADFNTHAGRLRGVGETTAFAQANERASRDPARCPDHGGARSGEGRAPCPAAPDQRQFYTDADPLGLIPFARKVVCQEIDAAARARIRASPRCRWRFRDRGAIEIVRSDGSSPTTSALCPAQRPDRGRAERPARNRLFGLGGRYSMTICSSHDPEPGDRRRPRPGPGQPRSVAAPAGEMTVVLGPAGPAPLHEAVRPWPEGDFNRGHVGFGQDRRAGRRSWRHRHRRRIDDKAARLADHRHEGAPTQRNVLIEDGILKGYIQTGSRPPDGRRPTGNGRSRISATRRCRMTNTFMLAARTTREILKGEKRHLRQELRRRPADHP